MVKAALVPVWDRVGGLSTPSKMPGYSYSISALLCKTGSKLRDIPGSTCSGCYALKGRYLFSNVTSAHARRYASLDTATWSDDMATLINNLCRKVPYFRWHDAGDIQSVSHLRAIVKVCQLTPSVNHWIPTREYKIVADYRKQYGEFPTNLLVRLSGHMVDQLPPIGYGLPVSSVTTTHAMAGATICEASTRSGQCGPCRACWSPQVKHVSYPIH